MKKPGLTLQGTYNLNGKDYTCKGKDCLLMIDTVRANFPYGSSNFQAQFMTKLPDNRIVSVSFGDGLGSNLNMTDRASEDLLMWDGKVFKFDVTHLDYYKDSYLTEKKLMTIKDNKNFKQRVCELSFTPLSESAFVDQGFNYGLVAWK